MSKYCHFFYPRSNPSSYNYLSRCAGCNVLVLQLAGFFFGLKTYIVYYIGMS